MGALLQEQAVFSSLNSSCHQCLEPTESTFLMLQTTTHHIRETESHTTVVQLAF